MSEHIYSGHSGTITWLGRVEDREASLRATPCDRLQARFDGSAGDDHTGLTRASCSRTLGQHPRGTVIRNTRQLSVLCAEELAEVAATMGVANLDPALVGASMVLSGLPDFSHVPPSSRLIAPSGATLVIDVSNLPCVIPGPVIDSELPGKGREFKPAAKGRRGVTAWVLCEGVLCLGDALRLHVPGQRAWRVEI